MPHSEPAQWGTDRCRDCTGLEDGLAVEDERARKRRKIGETNEDAGSRAGRSQDVDQLPKPALHDEREHLRQGPKKPALRGVDRNAMNDTRGMQQATALAEAAAHSLGQKRGSPGTTQPGGSSIESQAEDANLDPSPTHLPVTTSSASQTKRLQRTDSALDLASGEQDYIALPSTAECPEWRYTKENNASNPSASQAATVVDGPASKSQPPPPERPTVIWVADPSKLPRTKKGKFYGVREGRVPGIYYSWPEAEAQVKGFSAGVYRSFAAAIEVEHYMNHTPEQYHYQPCTERCRPVQQCPPTPDTTQLPLAPLSGIADPAKRVKILQSLHNLDTSQIAALRAVAEGRNLFMTGAAGTGKSTVIKAIQEFYSGSNACVMKMAPTGIAALNIHGMTLHTYAGWVPKTDGVPLHKLCDRLARQKCRWRRLNTTDVLIIDEISMIQSSTLTRLSQMMQAVKASGPHAAQSSELPFGGVQVIATGDFYQLPPVLPFKTCLYCGQGLDGLKDRGQRDYVCKTHGAFHDEEKWAFCSPAWSACDFVNIELKKIHRQGETIFTDILNQCRLGFRWSERQEQMLLSHDHEVNEDEATLLSPKRAIATATNQRHMAKLGTFPLSYKSVDFFDWQKDRHPDLEHFGRRLNDRDPMSPLVEYEGGNVHGDTYRENNRHRYEQQLELRVNMIVLLVHNLDPGAGLVNGSLGKIVRFVDAKAENSPRARANDKDSPRSHDQLLTGEHRFHQADRTADFRKRQTHPRWPVVRFANGQERMVTAHCMIEELGESKPYSLLSRTQIPLLPGWAITIHKSQGMTLDRVVVDLHQCFETGQAYVALSRARSLKGMVVKSLPEPEVVSANRQVQEFYDRTFNGRH